MKRSGKAKTLLGCASKCQLSEETEGECNAFKFNDDTGSCQLAKLTFLEDPNVGETAVSFMLSETEADVLTMTCRGGSNCCGTESNRLCDEGSSPHSSCSQLKYRTLNCTDLLCEV